MKKHHIVFSLGLLGVIIIISATAFKKTGHASLNTLEPSIPIIDEIDETVTEINEVKESDETINPASVISVDAGASLEERTDSDHDGLSDAIEMKLGTDPYSNDSDQDGYQDGEEIDNGYSPLVAKADRSVATRAVHVDRERQLLYYIFNGVAVRTFPISTGLLQTPTPLGTFKIMNKVPIADYRGPGYYLPGVKWNLEFKKNYFIHGTYWHDKFGIQPMSHGCVNMSTLDAEKIYKFLQVGDQVTIYGKTPTGKVEK